MTAPIYRVLLLLAGLAVLLATYLTVDSWLTPAEAAPAPRPAAAAAPNTATATTDVPWNFSATGVTGTKPIICEAGEWMNDAGTGCEPLPTVTPEPAATEPRENEPGWDCATMGNKVCGSPDVDPSTYFEYLPDGRILYTPTGEIFCEDWARCGH